MEKSGQLKEELFGQMKFSGDESCDNFSKTSRDDDSDAG